MLFSVPSHQLTSARFVTVMIDPGLTPISGRAQLTAAYHAELGKTTAVSSLVRDAVQTGEAWGCDASSYSAERVSGDHALLLGDAASFVDPLSSFGVKKALASAWLGSVAVHTALIDARAASAAVTLFSEREQAMYEHLQRQSALLSRDAADAHEGGGAVEAYRLVSQVAKVDQVAPGAAAQVENAAAPGSQLAHERGDVLTDVVIACAFPEGGCRALVVLQGRSAGLGELGSGQLGKICHL